MENARILWVDDEIELLKPHLKFLELKGYSVRTSTNGYDALEMGILSGGNDSHGK